MEVQNKDNGSRRRAVNFDWGHLGKPLKGAALQLSINSDFYTSILTPGNFDLATLAQPF